MHVFWSYRGKEVVWQLKEVVFMTIGMMLKGIIVSNSLLINHIPVCFQCFVSQPDAL